MRVSVVFTVLNEAQSLSRLLDSLAAQTRPPDEVVVCDGGSTDGTLPLLESEGRLPLRIIRRPGTNISQGRNAAIEAAAGEVITVTDAGVQLSPRWLEEIVAPFEDARTQVVAGFFHPDPHTVFETAMGATVLPKFRDIDPLAPTHVLIVPNLVIPAMTDVTPEDEPVLGRLLAAAARIAEAEGLSEDGYRLIVNCGPDGGQEVPHLHLHLLGGRPLGPMLAE